MKTYRVYEAYENQGGGIEGVGNGWEYIDAESACEAAEIYIRGYPQNEIEDNTVIVATDDDGDSTHFYPKEQTNENV